MVELANGTVPYNSNKAQLAIGPSISDQPTAHNHDLEIEYGSDALAEQLSRLKLDYVALVPGSSYRGLHDSLVNFKGNSNPEMLVCLHEEHTIAIAHGYAKVARKPMAAAVHANVGLMHATMTVFNAFADRVPMLILGATGPLDASRRRAYIDWVHTAQDQAALIRPFIKFDDQPHGVNAAISSLIQATVATSSIPCAPTYVCLDVTLQEEPVDPATLHFPSTQRYFNSTERPGPSVEDVFRIVAAMSQSKKPLFLLGRMSATSKEWDERIRLAEKFNVRVLTDIKQSAVFPYPHRLNPVGSSLFISSQGAELIRAADLLVSFDWVDLAGTLKASGLPEPDAKIVHISMDHVLHNGWSKDHFALPPTDIHVHADPDKTLTAILSASEAFSPQKSAWPENPTPPPTTSVPVNGSSSPPSPSEDIFMPDLASTLYTVLPPSTFTLVRVPLGWNGTLHQLTHPLSYMGMDGAAGLGSACGQTVGTSLALRAAHSPLLAVSVIGDGEFLMGCTALWTAARYRLPLLVIVANNASYFNDEVHQERVARRRGRDVANKWIGMRLDDPRPDLHEIARGLGCCVVRDGQVAKKADLEGAVREAVRRVGMGDVVVLDVNVRPEGYVGALAEGEGRKEKEEDGKKEEKQNGEEKHNGEEKQKGEEK